MVYKRAEMFGTKYETEGKHSGKWETRLWKETWAEILTDDYLTVTLVIRLTTYSESIYADGHLHLNTIDVLDREHLSHL